MVVEKLYYLFVSILHKKLTKYKYKYLLLLDDIKDFDYDAIFMKSDILKRGRESAK
jgi:hypothetical protein